MHKLNLKASHKPVAEYYKALGQFKAINVKHETAVRAAFQTLLEACGNQFNWKLVPEWPIKRQKKNSLRVDGALVDEFRLTHGYWEAKDESDDLAKEVKRKFAAGYPNDNILFQAPTRAILWQNNKEILDADLNDAAQLVKALQLFFEYQPPAYEQWEQAVADFQQELPKFGTALTELIETQHKTNARFRDAFTSFYELCRQSINPNLSEKAVEEMLIQHLLTERIFRTIFKNSDFRSRNVIAREIEKVIDALTSQAFSREEFLKRFDHFYRAIEAAAATIEDFVQKQEFLNTVYERFFRGFSVEVADTHGIVYTPQPIVNFMVRSVEDILQKEFGKSLSSANVHILDPFVGTGNFIVRIMQEIKKTALQQKYRDELHCNEVMLLPYYIASMNIEHEFYELTGGYEQFAGICLVDTFELAEAQQISFFSTENTERVERQKRSPITVVIGNPPYNVGQLNENDNNKNRKYKVMDKRVVRTYSNDSNATLRNKLNDPYVKAIRWASDRIGNEGIIAFVTNNGFVDGIAFDGMRKHLAQDFDSIYVLDLGGNIRKNSKLSGTLHNVFGIQVGVSINLFVKKSDISKPSEAQIFYASVDSFWRKEDKYHYLDEVQISRNISWKKIQPNKKHTWLTEGMLDEFDTLMSLGNKAAKAAEESKAETIFKTYSGGIVTSRDIWVCNFNRDNLAANIELTIETYNNQVSKWKHLPQKLKNVDDFVTYDDAKMNWSGDLKNNLLKNVTLTYRSDRIRYSLYRPFTSKFLYFDPHLNNSRYLFPYFFPNETAEGENLVIGVAGVGDRKGFGCLASNRIAFFDLAFEKAQCFPFYTYNEDGTNRRENITDWALEQFRAHYKDQSITKWNIFHYVYALLHHPVYRERYAANLKRELPRIPFAPAFQTFAQAGARLAELHVHYEQQPEYPLEHVETPDAALDWRVEKMKLSKDKRSLVYNDFLTLGNIPQETYEYRLGNRSALEWLIDQYQISTDKRSGITNDPNRADDPQYIKRLIGQVITVSVETMKIVRALPELGIATKG